MATCNPLSAAPIGTDDQCQYDTLSVKLQIALAIKIVKDTSTWEEVPVTRVGSGGLPPVRFVATRGSTTTRMTLPPGDGHAYDHPDPGRRKPHLRRPGHRRWATGSFEWIDRASRFFDAKVVEERAAARHRDEVARFLTAGLRLQWHRSTALPSESWTRQEATLLWLAWSTTHFADAGARQLSLKSMTLCRLAHQSVMLPWAEREGIPEPALLDQPAALNRLSVFPDRP